MKLLFATSVVYPSRMANRLQTLAMVKAVGGLMRDNFHFGYSNISSTNFSGINHVELGKRKSPSLAIAYLWYIKKHKITHLHCREHRLLFFILTINKFVFRLRFDVTYESHTVYDSDVMYNYILRWSDRVIVLTSHTKKILETRGVKKIAVIPDAVDSSFFVSDKSKIDCRKQLHVPLESTIVLYAGQLFSWKGIDTLAKAAASLTSVKVVMVGGAEPDIERMRKEYAAYDNLQIVGYRPHQEIPLWLQAADVLVLPTSGTTEIGKLHTSPLKLFEYMASGRPIVASDLPSTREMLDESTATLVDPDNPEKLAGGIEDVIANPNVASKKSEKALKIVKEFTWDKRAQQVLDFIEA